jgi:integrase
MTLGRTIGKLTALAADRAKTPGKIGDGGGLWLEIDDGGAKSWSFRYTMHGRSREMGLGPLHTVSLAEARDKALECRKLKLEGVDPIEHRRAKIAAARLEAVNDLTFDECRALYIAAHRAGWRNAKHADQWKNTLETYATPIIGKLSVGAVDTGHVLRILEPIWTSIPETAGRVRGRIEAILDSAKAKGLRKGDNPARWRNHLDQLLAKRSKVKKKQHHPALPYSRIGEFIAELRVTTSVSRAALEFVILTLGRTSEVIGFRWPELDRVEKVWTVPPERMKGNREHRVPLSQRALELLDEMAKLGESGYVFPGAKADKPLSNMALEMLVRRMNGDSEPPIWCDRDGRAIVPHGFRSSFKDWASEQTNFANEVSEAALAHVIGDETEQAYRRGDMLLKRRRLMEAWAKYCDVKPPLADAKVAAIGRRRGNVAA